jgi:hypothetical protein
MEKKNPIYLDAILPLWNVSYELEQSHGREVFSYNLSGNLDSEDIGDVVFASTISARGYGILLSDMRALATKAMKEDPDNATLLKETFNQSLKDMIEILKSSALS